MEGWAIPFDGKTRRRLKPEQIEIGTLMSGPDGRSMLVFRDRFVGLRVASAAGTTLSEFRAGGVGTVN